MNFTRSLNTLSILTLLILLPGCAALKNAANVEKPKASVAGVSVSSLSLQDITLLVDIKVDNPNAFALQTSGFDLDLSVAGSKLANIAQPDNKMKIPANGSNQIGLPITLAFNDIYSAASGLKGKQSVDYGIKGEVKINVPVLGDISLPLSFDDVLPIPSLPKISLKDIKLISASFSGIKLNFDMDVTNPNIFGLTLDSLGYSLKAEDKTLSDGSVKSISLQKGETKTLSVPLSLSLSEMGMSLYKLLTGNQAINFALQGNADVAPDLGVWKPDTLNFKTEKSVSF